MNKTFALVAFCLLAHILERCFENNVWRRSGSFIGIKNSVSRLGIASLDESMFLFLSLNVRTKRIGKQDIERDVRK